MYEAILQKIIPLRRELHSMPELSGMETKTKARLIQFLQENTSLEIHPCGDGFYAAYREEPACPGLALRADYDALPLPGGGASHLCGHDGHAAALCSVALLLEQNKEKIGKNVFLLFQPAEETGAGAAPCCQLFDLEKVDEIYGAHNLPGFPAGKIFTRRSTFACGSLGMTIHFVGKPTHAAYPELGISPAPAVGALLCELPAILRTFDDPTVRCTVIGAEMGEKAFGAAAEKAEVWLTLRAEHEQQLQELKNAILCRAEELAAAGLLQFSHEEQDVFPATENHDACVEKLLSRCQAELLEVPMRWSEDFGHYLQKKNGAFFGVGVGVDYPGLHTETYEYPDEALQPTIRAFEQIINS